MSRLDLVSLLAGAAAHALVALAGCGRGAPGPVAPAAKAAASAPDLAGRWASPACEHAPDGQGGQLSFTRTFLLDADTWSIDFALFGDPACDDGARVFTLRVEGDYRVGAPAAGVPGAHEAFFGVARRTITPASDGAAASLAGASMCGRTDWKAGVATDIHEGGCPALGLQPAARCAGEHDLVRRDGDTLAFGARPADGNLCEPARRPAALGPALARR
jgi:hypothetical protein